ncbi:hypothetical protein Q8F55_008616 [Vanrija albida]|uniref:3-phytase n=1 Tax=Vanrija albida TaxID=181172 RepID=A0ABR3PRC3_9TREE
MSASSSRSASRARPGTPQRSESAPLLTPSRASSRSSRPGTPGARKPRRAPPVQFLPAVVTLVLFAAIALAAWNLSGGCSLPWLCDALGGPRESFEAVWWRNTGPYAAYRALGHGGGARGLPEGCVVDQVSVLHRHTGRYPTPHAAAHLKATLAKLADRAVRVPTNHQELHFLHSADFELADWVAGELTDQGRRAAWDSGKVYAGRYSLEPFVRSSGGGRVVETARFFLDGFYGRDFNLSGAVLAPDVVIPEGERVNSTLSVHSCAAFEALDPPAGSRERAAVAKLLQPTADRLNRLLGPRPPLDPDDVRRIADMCGYDTTARETWSGWSRWCKVLSRDEWEIVGYGADVERWYRVGEGGRFGKTMGAGYVNELLARLQDTHPTDHTTTNRTLDADPATFPPGGKRVFVDFTHDNEMIEILTALGIRKMRRKLPTSELPDDPTTRRWVLSELIPFGARWAFERVTCDPYVDVGTGRLGTPAARALRAGDDGRRSTFVRALINDRPARIDHMACRSSPLAQYHLCDLDSFIESQEWSVAHADWHECSRVKKV